MMKRCKNFPVRPEGELAVQDDDEGTWDIPGDFMEQQGRDVPEGQIVVHPSAEDEIDVNGTKLRVTSALSALRSACGFYNLSTSGSKQKCFQRIFRSSEETGIDHGDGSCKGCPTTDGTTTKGTAYCRAT